MKKARFTDEQMVRILREADNSPVATVAKKESVSRIYWSEKRPQVTARYQFFQM